MKTNQVLSAIEPDESPSFSKPVLFSVATLSRPLPSVVQAARENVPTPAKAVAKRMMSAKAKARIAAAQKKRWIAAKQSAE
jgi:hypothetical protein